MLQRRSVRWTFCDSPQRQRPGEAYIQVAGGALHDVQGRRGREIDDEGTKAFLTGYMEQFRAFIIRVMTVVPQNRP